MLHTPCDSDVLFEKLPTSWRCSVMVSDVHRHTYQRCLSSVGRLGNFVGACADTANSDRNEKDWPSHPWLQHAVARQALRDDVEDTGRLDSSETLTAHAASLQQLRHGYADLPWSTTQESEPTPTSAKSSALPQGVPGTGVRLLQIPSVRAARNATVCSTLVTSSRKQV